MTGSTYGQDERRTASSLGVALLSRGVHEDIRGPSTELIKGLIFAEYLPSPGIITNQVLGRVKDSTDGGVAESFPKLAPDDLGNTATEKIFALRVQGGKSQLGTGRRNEDLVLGHVSGRRMMFCVGDSPRIVGNTDTKIGGSGVSKIVFVWCQK